MVLMTSAHDENLFSMKTWEAHAELSQISDIQCKYHIKNITLYLQNDHFNGRISHIQANSLTTHLWFFFFFWAAIQKYFFFSSLFHHLDLRCIPAGQTEHRTRAIFQGARFSCGTHEREIERNSNSEGSRRYYAQTSLAEPNCLRQQPFPTWHFSTDT